MTQTAHIWKRYFANQNQFARQGGGEGGGGGLRLVTSIGELTLGPFPCQLSPGGDVFSF